MRGSIEVQKHFSSYPEVILEEDLAAFKPVFPDPQHTHAPTSYAMTPSSSSSCDSKWNLYNVSVLRLNPTGMKTLVGTGAAISWVRIQL
jgi:hypothetical protein